MELIPHNLSIDFVGKRKYFIVGSIIVNIAILLGIAIFSFNWGVDFAGGSELEVKFESATSPTQVRETMEAAGFQEANVQVVGAVQDNTFLIHVGRVSMMTPELAKKGEDALRAKFGQDLATYDYNPDYGDKIELRFRNPVPAEQVTETLDGAGIRVEKANDVPGGFTVYTSGISERVKAAFEKATLEKGEPKAELRRVEFVGPQVGKQLRNKGILSVLYAAIAILIYIALRFDTQFAPGAIVAMFHDIIVVLGYYLVSRREFNLTSVAVLLTIVGYSVNDTIVIYDRIRENLVKMKGLNLLSLINISLNETLARTVLTSFATALSLVGLLIFGVGQIWDFAAAMLLGIITGTYSSIYIASPMTIWLEEITGKRRHTSEPMPAAKAG